MPSSLDHLFSSFSPDPKKKSKASDSLNEIATILNRRKVAVSKVGVRKNLLNFLDACEERLLLENESVFKAARAQEIIRQSRDEAQVVVKAMKANKELKNLCENGTALPQEVKNILRENIQTTMATALSEEEASNIVQVGTDFTSEETTKDGFLTKLLSIRIPWIIHLMMLCYVLYLYLFKQANSMSSMWEIWDGRTPEPEQQTWTQSFMTASGIRISRSLPMIMSVIRFMSMNRAAATENMPFLENLPVADDRIVLAAPRNMELHEAPLIGMDAMYQDEMAVIDPQSRLLFVGLTAAINLAMDPRLMGTVMNLFSSPPQPEPQPEPGIPEQLNALLELLETDDRAWENLILLKIWPLLMITQMLLAINRRLD